MYRRIIDFFISFSDRDGRLTSRELEPFVCAPGLRDILCHDLNPLVDALIQQHLEGRAMHLDFADFAQLVDRTPRLAMLLDAVPLLGHAAANAWTLQQHVAAAQRAAQESAMKRTGAAGGNNNTSGSGTSGSGSGNSIGGASGSAGGLPPPMPPRAPTMLGQAIARPSLLSGNGTSTTPVGALPALILKVVPQPPQPPALSASASDSGSGSGAPPPPNGIVELAKSASASRLSPASSAASLHASGSASSLPVAADAKPAMPQMVPQPPQPLLPPSSGALLSPRSRSFKSLPPPMPPMRE